MYQSLTQVSMKLHLSKSAVLHRISKISNFRHKYCTRKKEKLYINDLGIKLINHQKHNSTSRFKHVRHGSSPIHKNRAQLIQIIKKLRNKDDMQSKTIFNLTNTNHSQQKIIANKSKYRSKYNKPKINQRTKQNIPPHNNAILPESFGEQLARKEIDNYKKHGPIYRLFHNIEN